LFYQLKNKETTRLFNKNVKLLNKKKNPQKKAALTKRQAASFFRKIKKDLVQ
jgi:hypothetical protein